MSKLREALSFYKIDGDVEIINECNETLLVATDVDENVCGLEKLLSDELLDREVLSSGVRDDRLMIKISGVEDAE
jgi:hypothetical protein